MGEMEKKTKLPFIIDQKHAGQVFWLLLALLLLLGFNGFAGDVRSVQSGSWSDPGTWDNGVPGQGDDVVVDGNHPMAGQTLNFDVRVVAIRDATPEELDHGHVHGPGGHVH